MNFRLTQSGTTNVISRCATSGSQRCSLVVRASAARSNRLQATLPTVSAAPCVQRSSSRGTVVVRASDPLLEEQVDTAKEAIDLGNKFCRAGRFQEGLAIFEKALTLPGTGQKRYRDKPRLISDGERQAALINIACCHSQLGDARSGLVALSGALELGYEDFNQLRTDADLAVLRQDERFEGLLVRFEPKAGGGLFGLGKLFGN